MSRWAETFAELSGGSDTLDTMRHSEIPHPTVSQSVNSVTVPRALIEPAIEAETQRAAIRENDRATPRFGLPEISDEPVRLRDGRRLWRFSEAQGCTPDHAATLIDQAHWYDAVLVADGRELIIVERWLSTLPVETLCELRRCASGVIEALHSQSRIRCQADARRLGDR